MPLTFYAVTSESSQCVSAGGKKSFFRKKNLGRERTKKARMNLEAKTRETCRRFLPLAIYSSRTPPRSARAHTRPARPSACDDPPDPPSSLPPPILFFDFFPPRPTFPNFRFFSSPFFQKKSIIERVSEVSGVRLFFEGSGFRSGCPGRVGSGIGSDRTDWDGYIYYISALRAFLSHISPSRGVVMGAFGGRIYVRAGGGGRWGESVGRGGRGKGECDKKRKQPSTQNVRRWVHIVRQGAYSWKKLNRNKYQRKTEDMSWHGGYEFISRCLIDVVWKSFRHPFSPFLRVGLVKDY